MFHHGRREQRTQVHWTVCAFPRLASARSGRMKPTVHSHPLFAARAFIKLLRSLRVECAETNAPSMAPYRCATAHKYNTFGMSIIIIINYNYYYYSKLCSE